MTMIDYRHRAPGQDGHDLSTALYCLVIRIRSNEALLQVCLHIQGICFCDEAPHCNRMTVTRQTQIIKNKNIHIKLAFFPYVFTS